MVMDTLPYRYVLWAHDINNKDWTLDGYQKLCIITNISEFWRLFNNFNKYGYKFRHFFLMKEGVVPIWEHETNRFGGMCSLKVDIGSSINVLTDLCVHMMCNRLTDDSNLDDINGISISPKNSWAIIKIWNKDCKNDISKNLLPSLIKKYEKMSIKYKPNKPEY
jgi:hypothetical protein